MSYRNLGFIYGILILSAISAFSLFISTAFIPFLSPLIIGILLGAALSPFYPKLKSIYNIQSAITFGAKKLLRAGIVFYGSYITFREITSLGINGFLIAFIIVVVVFICSIYIGKILKLDNEISMLVGIGSAVCGAAAILALESTLKTHPSKSSIALGFIVIFGLCGMIMLPLIYYSGLLPLNDYQWGIFIGASLHEVANVVGAAAISAESQNIAIIIKMTRVILIVPLLLIVSYFMFQNAQKQLAKLDSSTKKQNALYIPYFAFGFLAVIVLNSLIDFPLVIIESAQFISKLLLVFAMVALGLQIDWQKFITFGAKTFVLAFILFVILICGAYALVYFIF